MKFKLWEKVLYEGDDYMIFDYVGNGDYIISNLRYTRIVHEDNIEKIKEDNNEN